MPSKSQAQQEFFGIQLKKARAGQPHQVSEKVAKEFASTSRKGLPKHVKSKRKSK